VTKKDMTSRLDNIFVPMFTPFDPSSDGIDETQLRKNVRYLIERGIRILNPAGTTGEFWTLTPLEHRRVLRTVILQAKEMDPNVVVAAGVSTPNLAMTLNIARFAARCGADLLQITPTYYLPMLREDVVAYYRAISNAIDIPVMIYEIPAATGVQFDCDLLGQICDTCPNVVALKTASPLMAPWEFQRIMHRFKDRLHIFAATGAYFSPFTYMSGIHGITDTLANAVPKFGLTLHRLARSHSWQEMNRIYQDAFDVLEIEMIHGRAGLREIGIQCGLNLGPARYPKAPLLSKEVRKDIRRRLEAWTFSRELILDHRPLLAASEVTANSGH
jgi:4-hydroxy-tetrahydrodipicolinate synthase